MTDVQLHFLTNAMMYIGHFVNCNNSFPITSLCSSEMLSDMLLSMLHRHIDTELLV